MSELLPTRQAADLQQGLLDYLATTFALADSDVQSALREFLVDEQDGIFKGPYVRTRLPFAAAPEDGAPLLEGLPVGFTPYGHQAAAFARLRSPEIESPGSRPLPTLVTTGTGSGKTECFLFPILDHVLRVRRDPGRASTGLKALILYPMNALANDQALRLARLITDTAGGSNPLAGVTAALYTGQDGPTRTRVTPTSLITDRAVIRQSPPDILLTNYKMLDQLLLRHDDQELWRLSADSLQYVVLDEFHTYDGAQGTDVAMLLRRLGLALKSHWPPRGSSGDTHTPDEWERPLGRVTPVGTSATLGDKGDPAAMLGFAETIFGEPFPADCVITEARRPLSTWLASGANELADLEPIEITTTTAAEIVRAVDALDGAADAAQLCATVLGGMWSGRDGHPTAARPLLALAKGHPLVQKLIGLSTGAIHLRDLEAALFEGEDRSASALRWRLDFLTDLIAALSHLRAQHGREFVTVETHLWIRELTRIDRLASSLARFHWSDDGTIGQTDDEANDDIEAFPAIYCRHCGRSGWGAELAQTGTDLLPDQSRVRANHAAGEGRFRALIHAPSEALQRSDGGAVDGLCWLDVQSKRLDLHPPEPGDPRLVAGRLLPVLTVQGPDADAHSHQDVCPSCQQSDGIRFLGSAIATLLSVSLSTLFGAAGLDAVEKKALVFTDSVQDAAHRAGFVASRSHVLTLRAVLREAVGDRERSLTELVDAAIDLAGEDPAKRHRLLPPEFADSEDFRDFWASPHEAHRKPRATVRRRLLFDAALEFGLQSRIGRTLEQTGALAAFVDGGSPAALALDARTAIKGETVEQQLAHPLDGLADAHLTRWARGVLEHIRLQGGIQHEWLDLFVKEDGNRYRIWGGRRRDEGMPAFPKGRSAPAFPRVGGRKSSDPLLDPVTDTQSWYARWTAKTLGVSAHYGARLARALLARLAARQVLHAVNTDSGGVAYAIPPDRVIVAPTSAEDLSAQRHRLVCDVCHTGFSGSVITTSQLDGAPCLLARCSGTLDTQAMDPDNYYRKLYASADMRVIVAREHTSLLGDADRIVLENSFRQASGDPSAPNVLVATPTLEMGIDIGDLSTVFLSSLPRTVSSYLQRVGRAGRQTGNALDLAFVTGRGEFLPRLGDPLSMINGAVRPPATYLSAEEILQRQYLAHLMDGFARRPEDHFHPHTAGAAIGSAQPSSFLGRLVMEAETHAADHIDTFLRTFARIQPAAAQALSVWATPADGAGTSGLAADVFAAAQRWSSHRETLSHRRDGIMAAIPELELKATSPARTDDDARALRVAKAALNLVNRQLGEVDSEYWIGVLEEYGLLPNYTLLDDSVTLDVSMSWFDPDSGQYESSATSYQRGAANALREFAPGATFYARGFEIDVDAVDLGSGAEAIREWAFCPKCGYAEDLEAAGHTAAPASCPRCGSQGLADLQQRVPVVELQRASAEIRRDDARIDDRRDDRRRAGFTIIPAADIDPAQLRAPWFVTGYDFGAAYIQSLTLRWLNIGPRAVHAPGRSIAGRQLPTPLFRVCEGCGHLDRSARANAADEHRPWCPHRRAVDEHVRAIALSRTLRTQGAIITLPWTVTTGDGFALPSLEAAVLMGLRDQFGGTPSHIGVEVIKAPRPGGEDTVDALLLHDLVPGGTGYLADLADPHRMWTLLYGAWRTLTDCPCQTEGRLACHRCLLPLAPPHLAASVSRESARRHLRSILLSGSDIGEPTATMGWSIQDQPAVATSTESNLELHFRVAFLELLKGLNATIKETPGPQGNIINATLGGVQWKLEPQVLLPGCKPDFVVSTSLPVPQVAIFTDGYAFHASPGINNISKDATKRAALRKLGFEVLGITFPDVQRYLDHKDAPQPSWYTPQLAQMFMPTYNYNAAALKTLLDGPFGWLAAWIQNPLSTPMRQLALALPMLFIGGPAHAQVASGEDLARLAVDMLLDGSLPTTGEDHAVWWWRKGAIGALVRVRSVNHVDIALAIDDRPDTVASAGFKGDWQEWLRISNALALRSAAVHTEIVSVSSVATAPAPIVTAAADVSSLWAQTFELLIGEAAASLANQLADAGVAAPDLVGDELGEGVPVDFAWTTPKVAVLLNPEPSDVAGIEAEGWTVVEPNLSAIQAALATEEA